MENIRYGNLEATDEQVIDSAKAIGADAFIHGMEKGYQSEVGEGGNKLSIGEKQLLSFARAILADPRILILDEATSSIDSESEKVIQDATDILLKDRTSFIVAHRLSTIVKADLIVYLSAGKIVEQGSHKELLAKRGAYFDLYKRQFISEREEKINRNSLMTCDVKPARLFAGFFKSKTHQMKVYIKWVIELKKRWILFLLLSLFTIRIKAASIGFMWVETVIEVPLNANIEPYLNKPYAYLTDNYSDPDIYYEKNGVNYTFISTINTSVLKTYKIDFKVYSPKYRVGSIQTISFKIIDTDAPTLTKGLIIEVPVKSTSINVLNYIDYMDNYDKKV